MLKELITSRPIEYENDARWKQEIKSTTYGKYVDKCKTHFSYF